MGPMAEETSGEETLCARMLNLIQIVWSFKLAIIQVKTLCFVVCDLWSLYCVLQACTLPGSEDMADISSTEETEDSDSHISV